MTTETGILVTEFASSRSAYEALSRSVAGLIERLLSVNGIAVHSITQRCKTVESFSNKVEKKSSYETLGEITDLAGVRIITLFSEDVDVVAKLIEREFKIDRSNSIDKRASLDPDRFGYLSLHYVASLNKSRSSLQEYSGFGELKVEIQIRSILQHTWAEIEHDIGYKSAVEVPRTIRRRFSRLAGLLELADQEFIGIRKDLDTYDSSVKDRMKKGDAEILLDKISLSNFIASNAVCLDIDQAIAKIRGIPLYSSEVVPRVMEGLQQLGVLTISELESKLNEFRHAIIVRIEDVASQVSLGPKKIPFGSCIFFLVQVMVASTKDEKFITEYVALNHWPSSFVKYLMSFDPSEH
ncbi:hypothetical protein DB356_14220 [Pseudomonas congelans]|uniref:GTP pyrophosphokinase n=1 Tax=Pseudomonas congelans TaxID=200452 RepID=UPI001BDBDD36|nr:hypothetical protein [Pseudomonas congelans]QVX15782.1 hypothetical protein DB356_14220 [Pseudomonas congelans]